MKKIIENNIKLDKITEDTSSIICPLVILNFVRSLNDLKGCANITTALKDIGFGSNMLNGIIVLSEVSVFVRHIVYLVYENRYKDKYVNMYEEGYSLLAINDSIMNEPISEELKLKIKKYISEYVENIKI